MEAMSDRVRKATQQVGAGAGQGTGAAPELPTRAPGAGLPPLMVPQHPASLHCLRGGPVCVRLPPADAVYLEEGPWGSTSCSVPSLTLLSTQ